MQVFPKSSPNLVFPIRNLPGLYEVRTGSWGPGKRWGWDIVAQPHSAYHGWRSETSVVVKAKIETPIHKYWERKIIPRLGITHGVMRMELEVGGKHHSKTWSKTSRGNIECTSWPPPTPFSCLTYIWKAAKFPLFPNWDKSWVMDRPFSVQGWHQWMVWKLRFYAQAPI